MVEAVATTVTLGELELVLLMAGVLGTGRSVISSQDSSIITEGEGELAADEKSGLLPVLLLTEYPSCTFSRSNCKSCGLRVYKMSAVVGERGASHSKSFSSWANEKKVSHSVSAAVSLNCFFGELGSGTGSVIGGGDCKGNSTLLGFLPIP